MKAIKLSVRGIPSIGLFASVFGDFCIVGSDTDEEFKRKIRGTLDVDIFETTIAGTSLIGVFIVGDSKKVLVPSIARKDEIRELEDIFSEVLVLDSRYNALGNLISVTNKVILTGKLFEESIIKEISSFFGKDVYRIKIGNLPLVGSFLYYYNNSLLVSRIIREEELEKVKRILKGVKVAVGSVNFGSPYIRSGLLLNSNGFIVGSETSGHEILTIEETFFQD